MEQGQLNLNKLNEELMALKKEMSEIKLIIGEDVEFIKKTRDAWKAYDNGEFISQTEKEFLEDLEKC